MLYWALKLAQYYILKQLINPVLFNKYIVFLCIVMLLNKVSSKIVIRGNPLCPHHRRGLCAGLSTEGIYRHSGQRSRITELLKLFRTGDILFCSWLSPRSYCTNTPSQSLADDTLSMPDLRLLTFHLHFCCRHWLIS